MNRLTKAILSAAFGLGVLSPLCAIAEPTAPPNAADQKIFDDLFSVKLKIAYRTSEKEDDIALLDEMFNVAGNIPEDPGVQKLIYIEAIRLAASAGDIVAIIESANQLEKLWPGHEATTTENLITLADRAYRLAPREKRDAVGENFIDLLMTCAEVAAESDDYREANVYAKQAFGIARAIGSDREKAIDALSQHYSTESSISQKINLLTKAVERNPQNVPAARELVDLLLTKRDDPVAANQFAESIGDDETYQLIGKSALGPEKATAATALRLGDWYLAMAERQHDLYAEALLRRARLWYGHFGKTYTREDALAKRVETMDEVARGRLERILEARGVEIEPEKANKNTGWVNLIAAPYDPTKHVPGDANPADAVKVVEDGIALSRFKTLIVPAPAATVYELRLTVSANNLKGKESFIGTYLPFGDPNEDSAIMQYYFEGDKIARILFVEEIEESPNVPDPRDKKIQLTMQVMRTSETEVALAMLANNKPMVQWKGEIGKLWEIPNRAPPEEIGNGFVFYVTTDVTLHSVEYRIRGN